MPHSTFHFIDNVMADLASDADGAGWQNTLKRTLRDVPILRSLPVGGDAGRVATRTTPPRNVGLTVRTERCLPASDAPTDACVSGPHEQAKIQPRAAGQRHHADR